jgi:trk system potassium uptake protein TrkH
MFRQNAKTRWELPQGSRLAIWQKITPPQLFVASFALLIAAGGAALKLIPGNAAEAPLGWVDAMFMSTSAVCVTGLAVVDPGTVFTFQGQVVLLLLIQFGGLGILTFTSLIIAALGRRLSLREESLCIYTPDTSLHLTAGQVTMNIVRYTLIFEFVGAILLYIFWVPSLGWQGAVWPAVFHSVSAFCNAGFSTFSDNLMGFQRSPMILITISGLIVLGGLGFLTHEELLQIVKSRRAKKAYRLSLQSRIVIVTTIALIVGGWVVLTVLEWDRTLNELPVQHKIVNGLMMSITTRTAGFNSIDYGKAAESSNLVTMLLMAIGGSPGSTAGGIKTTTLALMIIMAWSKLRGQQTTSIWYRSIPEETSSRAVGLFTIASAVSLTGILLLTMSEGHLKPDGSVLTECMFEAISAFNTVGLSMGITPKLSVVGKWTTILLMFFGRVGLLTLAAALTVPRAGSKDFRYAYEDVVVG